MEDHASALLKDLALKYPVDIVTVKAPDPNPNKFWKPKLGERIRFLPSKKPHFEPISLYKIDPGSSSIKHIKYQVGTGCFLCDTFEEQRYDLFRDKMMVEAETEL